MSFGLVLPDAGIPLPDLVGLAGELEAAGYPSLWVGEVSGTDAVTHLTLLGAGTKRIALGTSIVPIYTRAPGLLAMSMASLARAFPGRVTCGLGVSSKMVVESWNAVPYERVLDRMRDTLRFLRLAFAGEKVDESFATFRIRGFRLSEVPDPPPPLFVAAAGPRMLELATREADGVILNWCSADDVDRFEGMPDDRSKVAVMVTVCPIADRAAALKRCAPLATQYLAVPGYAEQQRRLGRTQQLEPLWKAWAEGDRRGAVALLPDAVFDDLVIHGSHAECREKLREFAKRSGALPLAHIVPGDESLENAARALAPAG